MIIVGRIWILWGEVGIGCGLFRVIGVFVFGVGCMVNRSFEYDVVSKDV